MSKGRYVISILGAPLAGKATLLKSLAKLTKSEEPVWQKTPDSLATLKITAGTTEYLLKAAPGSVFYTERVFQWAAQDADIVVYMFSSGIVVDSLQEEYFQEYREVSRSLNKTWSDIPWLFVLNSRTKNDSIPVPHLIPPEYAQDVMAVNVKENNDVSKLWESILQQVQD